jgi:hypothetical protein
MCSVKTRVRQLMALLLIVAASPALGGGGDWKMGPFGPYWDDNSWPEFTPMYWMEEFMNRLDDDDDEIQSWMLRNQFPGQHPGTNAQGFYPQDNWRPETWTGSRAQSDRWANTAPHGAIPGGNTYIFGERNPSTDAPESETGPLPYLTPEEFARMPVELQREYKRAFDQEYPIVSSARTQIKPKSRLEVERRPLPNLTPQQYSRMPVEQQREYKRAFDREYDRTSRPPTNRKPSRERRPFPELTPREFARMPAELQREYRRAFDRKIGASPKSPDRPSYRPSYPERPRLPNLTPEEYARMPADLQHEYKRAFDREYSEYQARAGDDRRRRDAPQDNLRNAPVRNYRAR